MTSLVQSSMSAGLSSRQSPLSDAQVSGSTRQQTLSAYESLNAGVTIQTREGDLVTLNSNSFSSLNACGYNSKGLLETEDGSVSAQVTRQEITLASGQSFSFSVSGDLSEEELADITDIVKNIDEIISDMVEGDMDGAVATAMGMENYDSVSMYAADITHERSYSASL